MLMQCLEHARLEKLRPIGVSGVRFSPRFSVHVRHGQALAAARVGMGSAIVAQCLFDLDRQGVLPFNAVGVLRVHCTQQWPDVQHHAGMGTAFGGKRQALQLMRFFDKAIAPAGGWQQRFELSNSVVHVRISLANQ